MRQTTGSATAHLKLWLAPTALALTLTMSADAAQPFYCTGNVTDTWVDADGDVHAQLSDASRDYLVCDLAPTGGTIRYGLSIEVCRAWQNILVAAVLSGRRATLRYDAQTNPCGGTGQLNTQPPEYVRVDVP